MLRHEYPETVLEIIDDDMRFRASVIRSVCRFAESGPWRGSVDERKEKFKTLNRQLARAYRIAEPDLQFSRIDGGTSGGSHYIPALHQIVIQGKLSVVTYLHEFAHARGMGERDACRWSINLFRKCFSRQYARLLARGHMLISPRSLDAEPAGGKFR